MPTIRKIQLENGQSVSERLHAVAVDLLPNDMAQNPVVRWVVDHDSLNRLCDGRKNSTAIDDIEGFGKFAMVGRIVATLLQRKLPFYFGALFHIGRMRAVSEYCIRNVESLSAGGNNRSASEQNLASLLAENSPLSQKQFADEARRILSSLSAAGLQHASGQKLLATSWWNLWLKEAGALYDSTQRLQNAWEKTAGDRNNGRGMALIDAAMRTIILCQSSSCLAEAMKAAGVRMKTEVEGRLAGDFHRFAMPSLVFALAAMEGGPEDERHHFWHWEHLINRWISAEREIRLQPQVDIALEILRSKYGALNPFDEFLPLCRPASCELRMLAMEHTLPNSNPSPWRAAWEARLESPYIGYSGNPIKPPASLDPKSLDWAVRLADSAIKRNITLEINPNETWSSFVQRLYERFCVHELGRGAGCSNKDSGEKHSPWSVEGFALFIEAMTHGINKHGYELKCPNPARLEVLLTKTTKGEYLHPGEGW